MAEMLDFRVVLTLAARTWRQITRSPLAYVAAAFFFGFTGVLFTVPYFAAGLVSVAMVGVAANWVLWFVVPALAMNLLADEIKTGTFEVLATLPVRDAEIVLGKFLGLAAFLFMLVLGLGLFPVLSWLTSANGLDWGHAAGTLASVFLTGLLYAALGLFASSLTRNPVVALILGVLFSTVFFFAGQLASALPGAAAAVADGLGVVSHGEMLSKGVFDIRDILYFLSFTAFFLHVTVQRLVTRRF